VIDFLVEYPLVLLFLVASLGYLIGSIKIGGNALGLAAILFTGLAIGAIDERLKIPDIIFLLGLSIYVYSVGLSSGSAFFESYRKNGIRDFTFIVLMLISSGFIAASFFFLMDLSSAAISGLYCGSTTNTPALAGVLDVINNAFGSAEAEDLTKQAVLGYTYSYPMGVLGGMIAIVIMEKVLRIDYAKEAHSLRKDYPVGAKITSATVEVTQASCCEIPLRTLKQKHGWYVNFGRVFKGDKISLAHPDVEFGVGDIVMLVGEQEDLDIAIEDLGKITISAVTYDRTKFDGRRIFLSNPSLVGRTIASLDLREQYNAIVTRIRRGDTDMLAKSDTVLELGDRIRFMAERKDIYAISEYFGDSYSKSSKVDLFSFGLGIGLGLLLGSISIPLGSSSFQLGYAGGPLIVGLILGALKRSGPIVWVLPYGANVTLQQIGLIFLLSAIGVRSGSGFLQSIGTDAGLIFLASIVVAILTAVLMLFVGYKLVKIPFSILMGMVSNQPAILDFAENRSGTKIPEFGFTMMYPIALIMKIVIAQILFLILT